MDFATAQWSKISFKAKGRILSALLILLKLWSNLTIWSPPPSCQQTMHTHTQYTPEHLWGVQRLYATKQAFAAIKADGSVVTWGSPLHGGDCSLSPRKGWVAVNQNMMWDPGRRGSFSSRYARERFTSKHGNQFGHIVEILVEIHFFVWSHGGTLQKNLRKKIGKSRVTATAVLEEVSRPSFVDRFEEMTCPFDIHGPDV